MLSNQKISDYVYLAEASYTDFSNSKKEDGSYNSEDIEYIMKAPRDKGGSGLPESFAKLVTQNYKVIAHYKDRVENDWFDIDNLFSLCKRKWFFCHLISSK